MNKTMTTRPTIQMSLFTIPSFENVELQGSPR